jgi:hypothetical protein
MNAGCRRQAHRKSLQASSPQVSVARASQAFLESRAIVGFSWFCIGVDHPKAWMLIQKAIQDVD